MVVDTIVIQIPEIEEKYVLALLVAIQAYEKNAYDKHDAFYKARRLDVEFKLNLIIVRDPSLDKYDFIWLCCLNHLLEIVATNDVAVRTIYEHNLTLTSHVVLSYDVAANIARASRKGLYQSYGIMLGSENESLPDVTKLTPKSYAQDSNSLVGTLFTYINPATLKPAFTVRYAASLQERVADVFKFSCYMGEIGFESYLMSCLKKPVFEISSGDDPYLLSKWTNPNYFHSSTVDSKSVEKGITLCLNRSQPGK